MRVAARRALARIGVPAVPILRGERGAPLWPDGVVGSMTHTAGYCAAAVADAGKIRSVGIDAEEHDHAARRRAGRGRAAGRAGHARSGWAPDAHWDRLLFSAKESTYKAWFPLTGRWLGFEDALITIDPEQRHVHASQLLVDGATSDGPPLTGFDGRFLVRDGYVLTAITVPARRAELAPSYQWKPLVSLAIVVASLVNCCSPLPSLIVPPAPPAAVESGKIRYAW